MTIDQLNQLDPVALKEAFEKCCGASKWVDMMSAQQPYKNKKSLMILADHFWYRYCLEADCMEAFKHHPEIGDISTLEKKYAATSDWAGQEQSGVNTAKKEILERLANGNKTYKEKFGFIFIVCATGKSATEMAELLEARLSNDLKHELKIAMEEQAKITRIRLDKLLED